MTRLSSIDKIQRKREVLIDRTMRILGCNEDAAIDCFSGRLQSIRINTLRWTIDDADSYFAAQGWQISRSAICIDGRHAPKEVIDAIKADSYLTGKVYIQNASSWLPIEAMDIKPGLHIFDVCAAPGGKSSHIAARANNNLHLVLNDNARPRIYKMKSLQSTLGVSVTEYTQLAFERSYGSFEPESFDRILLDAPCSGEGMIDLDKPKSYEQWSVAKIKRLQTLQRKLLKHAWELLRPGGILVYSTCTLAPEENELVIQYLLQHNQEAHTLQIPKLQSLQNAHPALQRWQDRQILPMTAYRIEPQGPYEAFFVCAVQKSYANDLQDPKPLV